MKEYIFNIHDLTLIMTVAECLLLCVFQQALPIRDRNYGRLLSLFLLTVATAAACTLLLWNDQFRPSSPLGQTLQPYLLFTTLMLKGPAFYLFVSALTKHDLRLQRRHALHLTPALLMAILIFAFGLSSDDLRYVRTGAEALPIGLVDRVWDLAKLVPLAYALAAVLMLRRYRGELEDEYSHFSTTELSWLNILTYGVLISWSWSLLVHLLGYRIPASTADMLGIIDNYTTCILVNAFFAYSLSYAHQLLATRPQPSRESSEEKPPESAVARVRQAMETEKIYLKKNLSLDIFSKSIQLSPRVVSSVVNKHFGTNFFEFINTYRVEEAKALLADASRAEMTIMDILLECGFNSKSAFNRFFSRLTGMSPREYRKQALEKSQLATAS
ncbi:AraC family transcriptional regulator [Microbulbifer celer]|uniref:Helix-turn-helix domain-containing protein n=1 Tax=Microbulbifer celer TaxID=435905 RepID=A0ABW3UA94_9GAMM|nr:helix-turn-helix domain-containing protein [Microbulbifer celer]UFN59018.1 helix-turn-helix domain-containing protein [Microbulbifer celer]